MHTCPECGQACTCNGDIDDIMWDDNDPQSINCVHVDLTGCDREDDDDIGVPTDDATESLVWERDFAEARFATMREEREALHGLINIYFAGLRNIVVGYTFAEPTAERCTAVVKEAQKTLERGEKYQKELSELAAKGLAT